MKFGPYAFGSVTIDGIRYYSDLVIDRGEVRKRVKTASKKYREQQGHTPLSLDEYIPWNCRRLVVGTGAMGELPVMEEVKQEAKRRKVKLIIAPTAEAIQTLNHSSAETNAILHLTC